MNINDLNNLFKGFIIQDAHVINTDKWCNYTIIKNECILCSYPYSKRYDCHLGIQNETTGEFYDLESAINYRKFNKKVIKFILSQPNPKTFMIIYSNHPFFSCAIKEILDNNISQ